MPTLDQALRGTSCGIIVYFCFCLFLWCWHDAQLSIMSLMSARLMQGQYTEFLALFLVLLVPKCSTCNCFLMSAIILGWWFWITLMLTPIQYKVRDECWRMALRFLPNFFELMAIRLWCAVWVSCSCLFLLWLIEAGDGE